MAMPTALASSAPWIGCLTVFQRRSAAVELCNRAGGCYSIRMPDDGQKPAGVPQLRLRLLGPFEARLGDAPLRLRNRKAQALLGCLALGARGGETRARIAALLWSESEDDRARATLRQTILELRNVLPDGSGFVAQRDNLLLDNVQTDLREVQDALNAGIVHPLLLDVPRLSETLLDGFEDIDSAVRPWLLGLRRGLTRQWMRALEAMLERSTDKPALAATLLRLDPTHEAACRMVMQAAHAAGDTAGALRAYETLWDALGAEHDMEPSAQTQALIAEIKSADPPAPAPITLRGVPVRLAVMVPPFPEDGVTQERIHLLRGFRQELLACLTRFREWYVVDGDALPPAAANARVATRMSLNAAGVEMGGVLSLALTLRDEETRVVVWSDRFELTLQDWFTLRQRVVSQVAVSMLGSVSAARLAETAAVPDINLAAHDKWAVHHPPVPATALEARGAAVPGGHQGRAGILAALVVIGADGQCDPHLARRHAPHA